MYDDPFRGNIHFDKQFILQVPRDTLGIFHVVKYRISKKSVENQNPIGISPASGQVWTAGLREAGPKGGEVPRSVRGSEGLRN